MGMLGLIGEMTDGEHVSGATPGDAVLRWS
jgi:hypothetical protein